MDSPMPLPPPPIPAPEPAPVTPAANATITTGPGDVQSSMAIKDGHLTTEFWLTVLTQVIAVVANSGLFPATSTVAKAIATAGAVVAVVIYSLGRAHVKASAVTAAGRAAS